jgi:hypothetical protein
MINEVVIGLDPHKASNTIAVLDRHEALLTRPRFGHNDEGLVAMFGAVAGRPKRVCAPDYRRYQIVRPSRGRRGYRMPRATRSRRASEVTSRWPAA